MRGILSAALSLIVALSLCACVHYVPREEGGTQASAEVPSDTGGIEDSTQTLPPQDSDSATTAPSNSDPTTDTNAPTEAETGFPNEAESDGTKRY
ncbi:MAG: hypothetical protein IJW30_04445 [Clostridia bacterium]|nr:hypothetical protein [Clostridia bacterium]